MRAIPLSNYALETVPEVCERKGKGWSASTVQNWIHADLLPVVVVGSGRSAKFLLRTEDVDQFTPPARGRPPAKPRPAAHAKLRRKSKT